MRENKHKKTVLAKWIMVVPISLWMLLLVAVPFLIVLIISFMKSATYGGVELGFSLKSYAGIMESTYLKVFLKSFFIAAFVTVICILIAYPFAYFIAGKTAVKKTVFMGMVMVPFCISSLIRLFSWITLLRRDGILNQFLLALGIIKEPLKLVYNQTGAVIGLIYMLLPFMVLPLYSSIEKLDKTLLEACSDLGAKPVTGFLKVTLPLTRAGIFAGSILVFIPTLGLYFVTDLLGGSKTLLIGNVIRNQFITARNWPMGSALSMLLIFITLLLVGIYQKSGGNMDDLGV
ncbi:ABC transporter permease [Lachnospiraceae bacterium 54-53]